MALAGWAVAPYVVPHLLRRGFGDTVQVIQILVWSLVPILFSNQLRYVYIALSRENRFIVFNIIYLVLKGGILAVLTWRFGLWGACYGAVVSELVLAVLVWYGVAGVNVALRFAWPGALATVVTAACLAVLWKLSSGHQAAFGVVAVAYLLIAVYVVNRLMRTVREHIPRAVRGDDTVVSSASGG
jgi:O-antigen/teichoic acid export membrane protein